MKKLFALMLVAVMVLSMAACESSPAGSAAPAAQSGDQAEAESKVYKVAMICDSSISDGGWGAACYNAMIGAAELNGWENTMARAFNVYAIPHTVIVAQDGVILQNGLIGNDLINDIEKQFSK